MNKIRERLYKIAEYNGLSMRKFEELCNLKRGNISNMTESGTIGSDKLSKIIDAFSDINIEWLLTGKGDMLKPEDEQHSLIPMSSPEGGIPLVPIEAWAGLFHGEQAVALSDCEHFFVPAFKDADFLIPVRGDSMIPRYYSGDLVACKYLPLSDIFFQWGKVYVLDTNQGALIKKVRPGSTNDTITLISENPNYEPFELPRSCIYNIALVQGLIRGE